MTNEKQGLRKFVHLFRSAITGRFVTKRFAEKHPHVTVRERRMVKKDLKEEGQ